MITNEKLKEMLNYNPDTGEFTWLDYKLPSGKQRRKSGLTSVGSVAGSKTNNGYISIRLNKKAYYAHRLAWFYIYNEWPIELDHSNGNTIDNRICNLRLATRSQQNANTKLRDNNKNKLKGVAKNGKRFGAYIGVGKSKTKYLGTFDTAIEAHNAYLKAAKELFGEFVRES